MNQRYDGTAGISRREAMRRGIAGAAALAAAGRLGSQGLLAAEDEKAGFRRTASGMTTPRIHTAARAIGLARGALEDSIAYVQQRKQFDHFIGDFQAIRFKIANMAAEIEACRALMYQVANDADNGEKSDHGGAMVKYLASEMAERVTSEALQIRGAGYTTDFAVERYWRDARLTKIFEGTSEIMQRIISDGLLPATSLR